jgi:RNA polymerase sigma-70 factor, ECF subfamily
VSDFLQPGRVTRDRRLEFERVALPIAPALYRTARRHVGQTDDAKDVVQETFLRAYRTFAAFQDGTNAKAWLFTILYSILSNRWRRDSRIPEEVSFDDVDGRFESSVAVAADGERSLLARLDASPEIEAALRQLPDTHRAVVLMVDVEDMTYQEVAAALDCPIGTVRSRLARGRKLLCLALFDYARRIGMVKGT